jgi:hypothetical protein
LPFMPSASSVLVSFFPHKDRYAVLLRIREKKG